MEVKQRAPRPVRRPNAGPMPTAHGLPPDRHQSAVHHDSVPRTTLHIGDVEVSARPSLLGTLLGSCIAVCLFDPSRSIGGMNHILLPEGEDRANGSRFGVHAMELLINKLMAHGVDRRQLVAKAFGGASVLGGMDNLKIGDKNAAFVRSFLQVEGIPLVAQRLGGRQAVHIYFRTDTGKVIVRTVDGSKLPKIFDDEAAYRKAKQVAVPDNDEITLF